MPPDGKLSNCFMRITHVIASAETTTCAKFGGDIHWDGHLDIKTTAMPGLFLMADQDLAPTENVTMGSAAGGTADSGSFLAGDQVTADTSSASYYGSVIAADECDPSSSLVPDNVIKNPAVHYDPTGYSPLTDVVNTTLWLELTG